MIFLALLIFFVVIGAVEFDGRNDYAQGFMVLGSLELIAELAMIAKHI